MAELRWVLLALGVLLVVGVYLWGRGVFRRSELVRISPRRRAEPHISTEPELSSDDVLFTRPGEIEDAETPFVDEPEAGLEQAGPVDEVGAPAPKEGKGPPPPEKIVALRFVTKTLELDGEQAVAALREAGLEHGRYGIFHSHDEIRRNETRFSVASLTEPGSFDLDNLADKPIAGMSFFMVLPGFGDPVERFDAMVQTARSLAHQLDAELFDDAGSSWSVQRERYVREELIRYRHQLM